MSILLTTLKNSTKIYEMYFALLKCELFPSKWSIIVLRLEISDEIVGQSGSFISCLSFHGRGKWLGFNTYIDRQVSLFLLKFPSSSTVLNTPVYITLWLQKNHMTNVKFLSMSLDNENDWLRLSKKQFSSNPFSHGNKIIISHTLPDKSSKTFMQKKNIQVLVSLIWTNHVKYINIFIPMI